jgi:hypothetical protein
MIGITERDYRKKNKSRRRQKRHGRETQYSTYRSLVDDEGVDDLPVARRTRCFPGGHGKTATHDEHESLMNDLEHKVFSRLHDDTHVYPGHGDDTTLGGERPHLQEWQQRGW